MRKAGLSLLFVLLLFACSNSNSTIIPLKSSGTEVLESQIEKGDTITVAFASVVSPQETRVKYDLLINYLEEKLERPIIIVQKQTYDEVSHDYSVSAVARGAVDAAAVDSLLFDQLVKLNNDDASLVKIIEYGKYAGTPPIVVSKKIEQQVKQKIKNVILGLKDDPIGRGILQELKIDEYVEIDDEKYLPIKNMLHLLGDDNVED
uniref:Solute-binding protein family 3/N-terminal domain-containing protein n=1 Tax=Anaerobacillus isosaccharinicus TaxID=1532552 RepID=A0A1S2L694_9BACI